MPEDYLSAQLTQRSAEYYRCGDLRYAVTLAQRYLRDENSRVSDIAARFVTRDLRRIFDLKDWRAIALLISTFIKDCEDAKVGYGR
jgi:hypothetical protein